MHPTLSKWLSTLELYWPWFRLGFFDFPHVIKKTEKKHANTAGALPLRSSRITAHMSLRLRVLVQNGCSDCPDFPRSPHFGQPHFLYRYQWRQSREVFRIFKDNRPREQSDAISLAVNNRMSVPPLGPESGRSNANSQLLITFIWEMILGERIPMAPFRVFPVLLRERTTSDLWALMQAAIAGPSETGRRSAATLSDALLPISDGIYHHSFATFCR